MSGVNKTGWEYGRMSEHFLHSKLCLTVLLHVVLYHDMMPFCPKKNIKQTIIIVSVGRVVTVVTVAKVVAIVAVWTVAT